MDVVDLLTDTDEDMQRVMYKGYAVQVLYVEEVDKFFGTICNGKKEYEMYFQGNDKKELAKNMQEAIDGHLENCKALGIEVDHPYL